MSAENEQTPGPSTPGSHAHPTDRHQAARSAQIVAGGCDRELVDDVVCVLDAAQANAGYGLLGLLDRDLALESVAKLTARAELMLRGAA